MRRTLVCQNHLADCPGHFLHLCTCTWGRKDHLLRSCSLMFNFMSRTLVSAVILSTVLFVGTSAALAQTPQSTPRPTPPPGDPTRPPGNDPIPGTTTPTTPTQQNPQAPPGTPTTNPTAPPATVPSQT